MDDLPPIAPGYTRISGKRLPPASWGDRLFVQLRNGMLPSEPWTVSTTRWVWDGIAPEGDVVAVKAVAGVGKKDGRQANGSYE